MSVLKNKYEAGELGLPNIVVKADSSLLVEQIRKVVEQALTLTLSWMAPVVGTSNLKTNLRFSLYFLK